MSIPLRISLSKNIGCNIVLQTNCKSKVYASFENKKTKTPALS
jgi:hypothetical protein